MVDDEKLIVKGIRFSLEQDDMKVDCAYDGEEALELAKENKYDLILLDVMLPKHDGFEVCQMIREFSAFSPSDVSDESIPNCESAISDIVEATFSSITSSIGVKSVIRLATTGVAKKTIANVTIVVARDTVILIAPLQKPVIIPITNIAPTTYTNQSIYSPYFTRRTFSIPSVLITMYLFTPGTGSISNILLSMLPSNL